MDKKDNSYLGTAPVGRLLFQLAIPTITAQIINMLYNIVDRIYIGHMPGDGDLALTGVGVCLPIIMLVSAFASLTSAGGAPRASIYMGQGNMDAAEKTMGGCFTLQLIISAVLTAVLLLGHRWFLMSFGASENTIGYATAYLQIYACGTVFVQVTLGMNAYITGQGFARTGMLTVLIGAICNIILDPIFIFLLHMGVRGAALATILSQGISCVWVVRFLCGNKTILRLRRESMPIQPALVFPCVALGLAPFIMQSSESILNVCFNTSLQRYGGDIAVGAMTILSSVMQFAMLPLQGLCQGAQPITSYNFGARNRDRVRQTFRLLLTAGLTYATVFWALVELFPHVFAGIFTPDQTLIAFSARALRVYCGAMLLFGIQMSCQFTFISLGNAKSSAIVAIVRKLVLLIPLIYIMPLFMEDKTMAVYTAEPVADVLAVTFTVIVFAGQFRKALQEMGPSDGQLQKTP